MDVDRGHLIQLVRRIVDLDGTEEEIDALIREFCASIPHPEGLDLLGSSDSPEAIVDEALSFVAQPMPASWKK
jgi:hypothetical protein